ncbi:MAG: ATP-binding cassette domain-containing protein [Methylophaga sp.]|nr:ATP-binding cassette domain-containing protein [Methylophaga sp.]
MTKAYQLSNIKLSYQQTLALDIPELSIPAGKCVALLGENGSGKSTLLKLLAFTSQANQGVITFFEQAIKSSLNTSQRQKIGFVDQHPYLLPGSVEDNLKLALKLQGIPVEKHRQFIQQALEQTKTGHLAQKASNTLSGGELKRVAIARAIVYQPDILLLDEPFSHLDQRHIQHLEEFIINFSQQENKTVIFSSHDRLQGMAMADEVINLVAGKTTASPLLNVFHGTLAQHIFDTGKIQIHSTSTLTEAHHIAINPQEIIISAQPLQSSMRNSFNGRLILIAEEEEFVRLTVDCGESFHVMISPESLKNLNLSLGNTLFLSFKSTAVTVF